MTTRAELEETNDRLQSRIEQLETELGESVPREDYEAQSERLREVVSERDDLRETVRTYELRRQNELLQAQEDRARMEERRQIDLDRLGDASRKLAEERARMQEERRSAEESWAAERERLEGELGKAQAAERRARTQAENWEKMSTKAADDRLQALTKARESEVTIRTLEANNHGLHSALERIRNAPPRPAWVEFLDLMGNNVGVFWFLTLVAFLLVTFVYVVIWIWNWMWQ